MDGIEEYDEAAATKKIIEKALAESALESKYGNVDDLEEVPFEVSITMITFFIYLRVSRYMQQI